MNRHFLISFCNLNPKTLPLAIYDVITDELSWVELPQSDIRFVSGTGLCRFAEGYILAAMDDEDRCLILRLDHRCAYVGHWYLTDILDIHSIHAFEEEILAVSTGSNRVYAIRFEDGECRTREVIALREERFDQIHLNSLWVDGNNIYVSYFGDQIENDWRATTQGTVLQLGGEPIASGVAHPHSVVLHQGAVYFCESQSGRVKVFKDELVHTVFDYEGLYVRGLHVSPDRILVGISGVRKHKTARGVSPTHEALSAVSLSGVSVLISVEGIGWIEHKRFLFDGMPTEIYDILPLDGDVSEVPRILFPRQKVVMDAMEGIGSAFGSYFPSYLFRDSLMLRFGCKKIWREERRVFDRPINLSGSELLLRVSSSHNPCEVSIAFSSKGWDESGLLLDAREYKIHVLRDTRLLCFSTRETRPLQGALDWQSIKAIVVGCTASNTQVSIAMGTYDTRLLPVASPRDEGSLLRRFASRLDAAADELVLDSAWSDALFNLHQAPLDLRRDRLVALYIADAAQATFRIAVGNGSPEDISCSHTRWIICNEGLGAVSLGDDMPPTDNYNHLIDFSQISWIRVGGIGAGERIKFWLYAEEQGTDAFRLRS